MFVFIIKRKTKTRIIKQVNVALYVNICLIFLKNIVFDPPPSTRPLNYLIIYPENHIRELKHGVPLEFGDSDDIVEVVHQLVGRLTHTTQMFLVLNILQYSLFL